MKNADFSCKFAEKRMPTVTVLMPGWATDGRVFDKLELASDYIVAMSVTTDDFFDRLAGILSEDGRKATLIGWSLGGLFALHFAAKYPTLVKKAVIVGLKSAYLKIEIEKMRALLMKDAPSYLEYFYDKCLSGHGEDDKKWFDCSLRGAYIREMSRERLLRELEYFYAAGIPVGELNESGVDITFVNGARDVIAPAAGMAALKEKLPHASFVALDTGHITFLHPAFKKIIEEQNV